MELWDETAREETQKPSDEEDEELMEKAKLDEVFRIWQWSRQLRTIRKESADKKEALLKMCAPGEIRFNANDSFRFPSKIVEDVLYNFKDNLLNVSRRQRELPFQRGADFPLHEIFLYLDDFKEGINEENVEGLLVMLIDTALYKAYELLTGISAGRLVFQLNACILLDAMVLKPDVIAKDDLNDLSVLLGVVAKKADTRMEILDAEMVWAIAMLSYKTQRYGRARRYFTHYIQLVEKDATSLSRNAKQYMYAKIAIGYCFEKREGFEEEENEKDHFSRAIEHFEGLLSEMLLIKSDSSNNNGGVILEKVDDYIVELHHGLGHFYNERAVFGKSPASGSPKDILSARRHMRYALKKKPEEFASCYGSLFHEYRDYEAALDVFDTFKENKELSQNDELKQELQFYIAQSSVLYSEGARVASENQLTDFEDYCRKTFNYDGIIHARIFRTRAYLRHVPFTDRSPHKKERRETIATLYSELTEFSLSNYAAKSIRDEYEKAKFMLRVYRSLYWDNDFVWRMEDIQYNLEKFVSYMPQDVLQIENRNPTDQPPRQTNLYIITVNKLDIWCIASSPFPSGLLKENGGIVERYVAVNNTGAVYHDMEFSKYTNYIVVIPPELKDNHLVNEDNDEDKFEREAMSIGALHSNLCFIVPRCTPPYDQEWVHNYLTGKSRNVTSVSVGNDTEAVQYAFCFRAFSIMRNELLQPMPLFTLVPTHLSLAYNYQEGESLNLLVDAMRNQSYMGNSEASTYSLYWRLGEAYKQKRVPINQNIFKEERKSANFAVSSQDSVTLKERLEELHQYQGMIPCIDRAVLTVCCPDPVEETSETSLSYRISKPDSFEHLVFSQIASGHIDSKKIYRIKATRDYPQIYFTLRDALEQCRTCKDNCLTYGLDECSHYCAGQESVDGIRETIESRSFELLKLILDKDWSTNAQPTFERGDLDKKYRCVLRQTIEDDGQAIYIMLLDNAASSDANRKTAPQFHSMATSSDSEIRPIKVCLSYAWSGAEYFKEVQTFAADLQVALGSNYDVDYDRRDGQPTESWLRKTVKLLKSGAKFVVLLSADYKRKADDDKPSGVRDEVDVLKEYIDDPVRTNDVFFAALPSQRDCKCRDLTPLALLNKKNVCYLHKEDPNAGHGYKALVEQIMRP